MVMSEFYFFGDMGRSGGLCQNCVASVVLERDTDIPASFTEEIPQVSCHGLFCAIMLQPRGPIGVVS